MRRMHLSTYILYSDFLCFDIYTVFFYYFFFFFQAEDGIRDLTVTGVQTCALPILDGIAGSLDELVALSSRSWRGTDSEAPARCDLVHLSHRDSTLDRPDPSAQIGRASCRERV